MDSISTNSQVVQLQNSLRVVFQKLSDEKLKNDSLEYKVEEMMLKVKTNSLFKQELSSLQKKVKNLKNENKFLKIRVEVQKRSTTPIKRREIDRNRKEGSMSELNGTKKKKNKSMNHMSRFFPLMGRRDSFSVTQSTSNDHPSVYEERIKKKRILIKCKELRGRVNLIRIGLGHVRNDLDHFNEQISSMIENMNDQTMMFSSNVFLPKIANVQDNQDNRIRFLENEIQYWRRKLKKVEWKFAVKQQKMIYQFGMIDFYKQSPVNENSTKRRK